MPSNGRWDLIRRVKVKKFLYENEVRNYVSIEIEVMYVCGIFQSGFSFNVHKNFCHQGVSQSVGPYDKWLVVKMRYGCNWLKILSSSRLYYQRL